MPVSTTTYYQNSLGRPSYSSPTSPPSPDRQRSSKKQDKWIIQHGSKLHSYGRDKAPYPLSYNREVLEMSCIDHALIYRLKGSVSFINFKGDTPKRCLDLGTGIGDWIIDAAKEWTDCTFVGYDLVNVQIPLFALDDSIATRIEWVHGNFLRQKLPFEDDEFDHVHIHGLACAVPENKWHSLYEEVYRVLRPGGTVEIIEEDAIFPVLPRWFTAPLNAPLPRSNSPAEDGIDDRPVARLSCPTEFPHDHALLEHLFYSVFHNRFLNPTPSSVLPGYFSAFFGHVVSPPIIRFPMPPMAPLQSTRRGSLPAAEKYRRRSDGSDTSGSTQSSPSSDFSDHDLCRMERSLSVSTEASSVAMNSPDDADRSHNVPTPSPFFACRDEDGTQIGGATGIELYPQCNLENLDEHTLFIILNRAVGLVFAIKEAMWDELLDKVETNKEILFAYGWESGDFHREACRQKFETMIEQYRNDMHVRVSMWHSLSLNGWIPPRRDPLTKAELLEQERLRDAILDAQRTGKINDIKKPCRSIRLLVGVKVY